MGKASKKKRRHHRKAIPKQAQSAPRVRETKAPWHTVLEVLGGIAALTALALAAHDALREPEIHASAAEAENPLELRFSLLNPSLFFRMGEMRFICEMDNVRYESDASVNSMDFDESDLIASIEPGRKIEYSCSFNQAFHVPNSVISTKVRIIVNFKTLGASRKSISEDFTWTARSKHWTEGTIVN
jgi:hypothetical protein